jgi:hypothetical protein
LKTYIRIDWRILKKDEFLDAFDQPKLNQEGYKQHNRAMKNNAIKAVTKSLPIKKTQDPMDSLANSTRPLRKN